MSYAKARSNHGTEELNLGRPLRSVNGSTLCRALIPVLSAFLIIALPLALAAQTTRPTDAASQSRQNTGSTRNERIQAYLISIGKIENFKKFARLLRNNSAGRDSSETPKSHGLSVPQVRDYQIAQLAVLYDYDEVARLKKRGIDVIDARLSYDPGNADAVYDASDIIVVAKPLRVVPDNDRGDDYLSSAVFVVEEVLKGKLSSDTIYIRQQTGTRKNGTERYALHELIERQQRFAINGRQLLFISDKLYGLQAALKNMSPIRRDPVPYILSGGAFSLDGDSVTSPAPGHIWRPDFPKTLNEFRHSRERYNK